MDHFTVDECLNSAVVLVDSREHLGTKAVNGRLKSIGLPLHREALPFGDYSIYCTLPNGKKYSLADKVVVERKMSLNELSQNLFQSRDRFAREFDRAKQAGAKVYLIVENGSIDRIYGHTYKTKVHPNAYIASLLAWLSRYNMTVLFCKPENSGKLIHDVLYRELKERLTEMPNGQE